MFLTTYKAQFGILATKEQRIKNYNTQEMEMDKVFEEAVANSRKLPNQTNENLLSLYALYKQATEGDINGDRPSNPFDFAGNAKYNAWEAKKGISQDAAKKEYIELVKTLSA